MRNRNRIRRTGASAVLIVLLLIPLLGLLAFSVDYGFILFVRTDLQRVADQAAMAAARDLVPDENGNQDLDAVRARVREYVELNLGPEFEVNDSDIEIGRYDPDTIYSSVDLLNTGIQDTVRVTLRRDSLANTSVSLYFARLIGSDEIGVNATSAAVLQRGRYLEPGTGVFPFAMEEGVWDAIGQGDTVSIYGNGNIKDESGNGIPGNWGTVDIGPSTNGTSQMGQQIENGLSPSDLNALAGQGAIPSSEHIDAASSMTLQADTGLSSGLRQYVEAVHGSLKLVPIYNNAQANGNNATFDIIGWGAVEVVDSRWQGKNNTYIEVKKTYLFSGDLTPSNDLSDTTVSIEGAYTTPALVQ